MTWPEWTSPDGRIRLINADCLEVLPDFYRKSFDAIITDPPYIVGAISVGMGNAKCGTWADMENAAWWFAQWFKSCRDLLKDTAHFATCGNWRSIPTLTCAFAKCQWPVSSCLIWDKQWIGPAAPNALRPTYEIVMLAPMPNAVIKNRSASDIFRGQKWLAGQCRTTENAAEKPVDLMIYLIELLTPECGKVLDPFCGSATTAIACLKTGRAFIGIERDTANYAEAVERCKREYARTVLFNEQEAVA